MVQVLVCGACGATFDKKAFLDQHSQKEHGSRVTMPGRLSR